MNTDRLECATARAYLSARHDREQLDDMAAPLASHLTACPACRDFESQLAQLTPLFDTLRVLAPPPTLAGCLLTRASSTGSIEASHATRNATLFAPWVLQAAAGLIGFLSIFAMGRLRQQYPDVPDTHFPLDRFAHAGRAFLATKDFRALPERELMLHVSEGTGDRR